MKRMKTGLSVLAAAGLAVVMVPGLRAQDGGPMFAAFDRPGMHFGHPGAPVTGAPYSAQITEVSTQKLANGTVLTHEHTLTVARDSAGRVRDEVTFTPREEAGAAQAKAHTMVTLFDPAARTVTHWSDADTTAHVRTLPQHGPGDVHGEAKGDGAGAGPRAEAEDGEGRHGPHGRFQEQAVTTDLGTKTIAGVSATGTRKTITIPAGRMGNNEPLTITEEKWYSPELKIVVSETHDDPIHGTRTMTVTNLSRNEPAVEKFQVPAGYQVQTRSFDRGPEPPPVD